MIWGAISYANKTKLVYFLGNLNAVRYRYQVLTPHMLPAMNLCRELFQQDNARLPTVCATVFFLTNHYVIVLTWPSKSSDVNLIEILLTDLIDVINQIRNLCKLFVKNRVRIDCIHRLILSITRRVRAN